MCRHPWLRGLAVKERPGWGNKLEGARRSRKGCFKDRRGCWPGARRGREAEHAADKGLMVEWVSEEVQVLSWQGKLCGGDRQTGRRGGCGCPSVCSFGVWNCCARMLSLGWLGLHHHVLPSSSVPFFSAPLTVLLHPTTCQLPLNLERKRNVKGQSPRGP